MYFHHIPLPAVYSIYKCCGTSPRPTTVRNIKWGLVQDSFNYIFPEILITAGVVGGRFMCGFLFVCFEELVRYEAELSVWVLIP